MVLGTFIYQLNKLGSLIVRYMDLKIEYLEKKLDQMEDDQAWFLLLNLTGRMLTFFVINPKVNSHNLVINPKMMLDIQSYPTILAR